MNEIIAAIKGRRSVRRYKADPIKKDELDAIVET